MTSHSSSFFKCGRWDLNPHERNAHKILSLARLPVPTLPRIGCFKISYLSPTHINIPQLFLFGKYFLKFFYFFNNRFYLFNSYYVTFFDAAERPQVILCSEKQCALSPVLLQALFSHSLRHLITFFIPSHLLPAV